MYTLGGDGYGFLNWVVIVPRALRPDMTATTPTSNAHEYEIAKRPPRTWQQILLAVLFSIVFTLGCVAINAAQFLLLPLRFLPVTGARSLYDAGQRQSKGAFGTLLGELDFGGTAVDCSLRPYHLQSL